jgi:hypothetical protein
MEADEAVADDAGSRQGAKTQRKTRASLSCAFAALREPVVVALAVFLNG